MLDRPAMLLQLKAARAKVLAARGKTLAKGQCAAVRCCAFVSIDRNTQRASLSICVDEVMRFSEGYNKDKGGRIQN